MCGALAAAHIMHILSLYMAYIIDTTGRAYKHVRHLPDDTVLRVQSTLVTRGGSPLQRV